MKVFLKTYWVELLFFVVGLVGTLIAYPFLPESIPVQWHNGQVSNTGPKWILLVLVLVQFAASYVVHYSLKRYFEKFPALAPALSGLDRLISIFISVILLSCLVCSMLAAWGVGVRVEVILLAELLLVPIVFIGFVAAKLFKNMGQMK